MIVQDNTLLDCDIIVSVEVIKNGIKYSYHEVYEQKLIKDMPLSTVGSAMQRNLYEAVRMAYAQALGEKEDTP